MLSANTYLHHLKGTVGQFTYQIVYFPNLIVVSEFIWGECFSRIGLAVKPCYFKSVLIFSYSAQESNQLKSIYML